MQLCHLVLTCEMRWGLLQDQANIPLLSPPATLSCSVRVSMSGLVMMVFATEIGDVRRV